MATSRLQSARPPGPRLRRRRPSPSTGASSSSKASPPVVSSRLPGAALPASSACAADDFLAYSFQRKAPYLVWDDEGSGCARHPHHPHYQGPLRSSRPWTLRHSRRCCPWPCVLAATLASALLFGALVALCAYLSGVVRVVEGDVWDPNLLNSTSKEFRIKSAKYANMLEAAYRKSPQLNSSLSKVTIYAFRQGSLIVLFELEVDKRRTPAVADLESEFRETLRREVEKGPLGAFGQLKIDRNAIEMTEMPGNSLPLQGNTVDEDGTTGSSSTVDDHDRDGDHEHRDSEQWINQHSQDPSDYFAQGDNETSPDGAGDVNSWKPFFPERREEGEQAEGDAGEVTWENAPELSEDDDSHYDGQQDRQEYSSNQPHQGGHGVPSANEHGSVVVTTKPQIVVTDLEDTTEESTDGCHRTSQDRFTNKHGSELTELTVGAGVVVKVNRNPVPTKNDSKTTPLRPLLVGFKDGPEQSAPSVSVRGPNVTASGSLPSMREPAVNNKGQRQLPFSPVNSGSSGGGPPLRPPYKPLSSSEITVGEAPAK
ncbi:hypothetical protein HPB50_022495 [Hyalomma asiaticum]|uniref:Uncharacterized protein n=1 Tax=Hyalomma asiaticum TaxID=266040 RepID=A0ACB7S4P8_HYAAI|nr:hypothetical protein HPB50_022495 [Hyalomma asiaticum]